MSSHRRETADFHISQSGEHAWLLHAESHELFEIKTKSRNSDGRESPSQDALMDVVHEDILRLKDTGDRKSVV